MKKALSFLTALVMLFSLLAVGASAANVVLSAQKLSCEGRSIECEKYNIDGSNYFKLRDIAYLLNGTVSQFSVGWDAGARIVSIVTGEAYEPNGSELVFSGDKSSTAAESTQTVKINGIVRSDLSVYNVGGSNFFRLRDLGGALGFLVDYDKASNTAVISSLSDAANPDEWLITRSTVRSQEGEVINTVDYTYDSAGRLIKEQETYDGGSSATAYIYDALGRLATDTYYSGDGSYSRRSSYTYDASGNKLSETYSYNDGSSFTTYYTYDDAGRPLTEGYDGDGYMYKYEYSYDADGNMLSSSYQTESDLYSYAYKTEYTYDADGNTLSETYSSSDGEMSTTLNTFDADGNMLSSDYMSSGGYGSLIEYEYGAGGLLIRESYSSSNGSGEVYRYDTEFEYDANGLMLLSRFRSDSSVSDTVYTYYDNGEMRSRVTEYGDGSISYAEYDADGQPLEFGYVDGDYSETTAYSYDALGNMLSYHSVMYGQEYYLFRSYDYAAGSYTECTNEPYYGGMA